MYKHCHIINISLIINLFDIQCKEVCHINPKDFESQFNMDISSIQRWLSLDSTIITIFLSKAISYVNGHCTALIFQELISELVSDDKFITRPMYQKVLINE